MKLYLTKTNRKTIDFVLLEYDEEGMIYSLSGKVGKGGARSTGWSENAPEEVQRIAKLWQDKGFVLSDIPVSIKYDNVVFDKAKWHVNENFPEDLDEYQSYVHTGMFICWLLINDLYDDAFKATNRQACDELLARQMTPALFYHDYFDGVFDIEGLKEDAIAFSLDYFDFEKGTYLEDYQSAFDADDSLPSLFHVADCWENYDLLSGKIDAAYALWQKGRRT